MSRIYDMRARRWLEEPPPAPVVGPVVRQVIIEWSESPEGGLDTVLRTPVGPGYTDAWLAVQLRQLAERME